MKTLFTIADIIIGGLFVAAFVLLEIKSKKTKS